MKSAIATGPGPAGFFARGRHVELEGGPLLMGVLNATPDSFSDSRTLPHGRAGGSSAASS